MATIVVSTDHTYSKVVKVVSITPIDDITAVKTESLFPIPLKVQTILLDGTKPTPPIAVATSQTYWITG